MGYSGRTPNYRIPYMFFGDILDPSEEEAIFSTIDNQLYGIARMHSGGNGIIRTGSLTIAPDGAGGYDVMLYDTAGNTAIEAFINQIFVASTNPVVWEGLSNNTTYYLYIRLIEGTEEGGSSRRDKTFVVAATTVADIPGDGVLVATVAVNEPGATVFDTAPAGRIDIPSLIDHMQDYQDPHGLLWQQTDLSVGTLTIAGTSTFNGVTTLSGNVYLGSGMTLDGIDPPTLLPLFSGINADSLHTHDMAALIPLTRQIARSPQYSDTVHSGVFPGSLETMRMGNDNIYRWIGGKNAATKRLTTQQYVPTDMFNVNSLKVKSAVDNPSGEDITVTLIDTHGNLVPLTGGVLANPSFAESVITSSGGQFAPGNCFLVNFDLTALSGLGVYLGDTVLVYNTSGIS